MGSADAELDAEIAALERAGVFTAPAAEQRPGSAVDPDSAPPDGLQAWLADLPGPLLEEYLAAEVEAAPEAPRAGLCGSRHARRSSVRGGGGGRYVAAWTSAGRFGRRRTGCGTEQVD